MNTDVKIHFDIIHSMYRLFEFNMHLIPDALNSIRWNSTAARRHLILSNLNSVSKVSIGSDP